MNKILSWKIDSGTYAYIYLPNSNTYISKRIPENSDLWEVIIGEVSRWDKNKFYDEFVKLSDEVKQKFNQTIIWDESFWNFADENAVDNVNIVLLSGKDGVGGYGGDGTGEGFEGGPGSEVYDKLKEAIDNELRKAKEDILKDNEEVKAFVNDKVTDTISEAKKTIENTKKELDEMRGDLEEKLGDAADALDKAAALFEMGEGGITPEKLQDVLTTVDEYGGWMDEFSGIVTSLKTDYDLAGKIGSIGEAESAVDGLFSHFATSLNVVSGTVGNVESWMVASAGTVGDFASWYNTNASSVTEASRIINASAATIQDTINFIQGDDLTTKITSTMCGASATMKDEIMAETSSAITNVTNIMNGISGLVENTITRLNSADSALTSMGERMNASEGTIEEWLTVTDSAMTLASDLREHWSVESGKLSSVTNLVAETDSEGNILYYASGLTGPEVRVYKNDNGEWIDSNGYVYYDSEVYVHYSSILGSYIQQEVSSITLSVMGEDNMTAAIKLAIEKDNDGQDTSIIKMVADKIVITGEMIADAIKANKAEIGGIILDYGRIYSSAVNAQETPLFIFNGHNGKIYAEDAEIRGAITATSLTLGETGESVESFIDDKMINDYVSLDRTFGNSENPEASTVKIERNGLLTAKNAIISGTIYAKSGDIGGFTLNNNMLKAYDKKDSNAIVAIINGSDEYEDTGEGGEEGKGKLILATGIAGEIKDAATKIYSNGLLYTRQLNTDGGEFKGSIEADGVFTGTLSGASGYMDGVIIGGNSRIDSSIKLNYNQTIKAINNNAPYFSVENVNLSDKSTEKWQITTINTSWQNHNGTNTGQTYSATTEILRFEFKNGATITIPAMTGEFYRYAPAKTCNASTVKLQCYYVYTGSSTKNYIVNETISIPAYSTRDPRQTKATNSSEKSFTATKDGYLVFTYYYKIHLSTYNLLGTDKAYVKLTFNTAEKTATVKYPTLNKGTNIGPNGARIITNNKCMLSVLGKEVRILSPSAKYGLKINDDGVFIRKNSTEETDWVSL